MITVFYVLFYVYPISKARSSTVRRYQGQKNPNKMVGTGAAMRRYPTSKGKGEGVRW